MSSLLDGLNEAQQQAVLTVKGQVMVAAGPGTGKTLTIVRRIARLAEEGVRPERILAVTFTNRAAREMQERTRALLGETVSQVCIGTFHFLGLRLLRESGRKDFALLNRDEQVALLKEITGLSARKAQQAADGISRIKNSLAAADDLQALFDKYQAALQERNACDFDDLIRIPCEMLEQADRKDRFGHIIVDEYQDINPLQYRLLMLLAGKGPNLCVVGDADQAIYSFRGADLGNFLRFEKDFPDSTRITLTQNYRSMGRIVQAADCVIQNNQQRLNKELVATREEGMPVIAVSAPDEAREASLIIQEIEARMGGTSHDQMRKNEAARQSVDCSRRFSDFAIIYRTNAQAKALEDAFSASGIPYQVIGKRGAIQSREIEETTAFLRSLLGEADDDTIAPAASLEEKLLSPADFFDPRADAVTLMTLHMAKGLEFPIVFLTGCEQGLLPCTIIREDADQEEERRLFYVGMTRAKDELYLTAARRRFLFGQRLEQTPSPYLSEIPEQFIERRVIPDQARKQKEPDRQMGLF